MCYNCLNYIPSRVKKDEGHLKTMKIEIENKRGLDLPPTHRERNKTNIKINSIKAFKCANLSNVV